MPPATATPWCWTSAIPRLPCCGRRRLSISLAISSNYTTRPIPAPVLRPRQPRPPALLLPRRLLRPRRRSNPPGTDKTDMDFRRSLPEIRCQSCLSPGLAVQFRQGGFAMRVLAVVLPLALATGAFGQAAHRNFGSVVFPGSTAGTSPGITRSFGSVVLPGGAPIQPGYGAAGVQTHLGKSNFRRNPAFGRGSGIAPAYIYAFPVYVGVYDNSNAPLEQAAPQEQAPPEPSGSGTIEAAPA